jgi:aminoglycoside phosphotransferase (APT) family kinase protein
MSSTLGITEELVSRLVAAQHPDLAHLPLRWVESGWDNAMFRLGDNLAVRLPRRGLAAGLIAHEQRWLPELAKDLPIPVPTPCRIGQPGPGYLWSWNVVPWLRGFTADDHEPHAGQAVPFARFLRALHSRLGANGAPKNAVRGVPLRQRAFVLEQRMQRLAGRTTLITPRIWRIWKEALAAPVEGAPTWLHGDLHPRNVVVDGGVISGIIDWGDITSGDCATDLASIWMLFGQPHVQCEALAAYGHILEATQYRAKRWAVLFGVILLDTGLNDNPRNTELGKRILPRVEKGI